MGKARILVVEEEALIELDLRRAVIAQTVRDGLDG